MDIIDIKFMGDSVYLLKSCTVTSEELKNTVETFDYNDLYHKYREYKEEYGVEKAKLPPMNFVFYKFIFENDSIPSPQNILDLYFEFYSDRIEVIYESAKIDGISYNLNALKARVLRTYPSLLRDFHFYLMLKECGYFHKVTYSCADDINGIDITIFHNNKKYIVSLFTDTKRSWSFKRIKNIFRHKYGQNELKVPLVLDESFKCGDFMLYKQSDVEQIINSVKNLQV